VAWRAAHGRLTLLARSRLPASSTA